MNFLLHPVSAPVFSLTVSLKLFYLGLQKYSKSDFVPSRNYNVWVHYYKQNQINCTNVIINMAKCQ